MDALTNVVAVLILVLILLQADVGKAVSRLLEDLVPATPEQVQQARDQLAKLTREHAATTALLAAKPPDPAQLDAAKAQLALLEKSLKESDVRLLAIDQLRQLQTKHEQALAAEQRQTAALRDEIRRLEALLATTPVPQPKKSDVVRIPNSREIPENANIYYAYVVGDRVHLVDPITAKKMVMEAFAKVRSKLLRETIKVKNGRDRKIYDQDKTVKHFAALGLKVRDQKITVPYNRTGTRLAVRIELDPEHGGVPLAELSKPRSEWHRICTLVRSYSRGVLIFRVRPDGFATYLKAREIADAVNMPCGWEISGATSHSETLDELEFNRLEDPPPPPPQPAAPAPPPGPPPPKRSLD
jgi:hypothetical protein